MRKSQRVICRLVVCARSLERPHLPQQSPHQQQGLDCRSGLLSSLAQGKVEGSLAKKWLCKKRSPVYCQRRALLTTRRDPVTAVREVLLILYLLGRVKV